jgi:hypothetical protein
METGEGKKKNQTNPKTKFLTSLGLAAHQTDTSPITVLTTIFTNGKALSKMPWLKY